MSAKKRPTPKTRPAAKARAAKTSPPAPVASTSPAASAPRSTTPSSERRIDHVVVLMLENRSFDHLMGLRSGVAGLTGKEQNLVDSTKPTSALNPAIHAGPGAPFDFAPPSQGPGHSFADANVQLTGSKQGPSASTPALNNGYVQQFKTELLSDHIDHPTTEQLAQVMRSFGPEQLPSINALADAFCVCDHWFSEVPGPTQPNRLYIHAATSAGFNYNQWSQKFAARTIYNSLQDAGFTWAVYWTDDNEVAEFTEVVSEADNFKDYATRFAADAKAGNLPHYTFIEPQFNHTHDRPADSQHPPNDARYGDHLVADVYEAVRSNEAAWAKTLLVVTYDEHGGFYDHVVPPSRGVPNPDGLNAPPRGAPSWVPAFAFDRLGMRVPAVLASPWIDPGVESRPLQHTSVLSTVKRLFGLPSFLTRRDASAPPFDDLLQKRSAPRTDTPQTLPRAPLPPTTTDPEDAANLGNRKLDATQHEVVQGAHALTAGAASPAEPVATTQHEAAHQMKRRIQAYLQQQKAAKRTRGQFQVSNDERGGHRWALVDAKGTPVAASARSFATRAAARKDASGLGTLAAGAEVVPSPGTPVGAAGPRSSRPAAPAKPARPPRRPPRAAKTAGSPTRAPASAKRGRRRG